MARLAIRLAGHFFIRLIHRRLPQDRGFEWGLLTFPVDAPRPRPDWTRGAPRKSGPVGPLCSAAVSRRPFPTPFRNPCRPATLACRP